MRRATGDVSSEMPAEREFQSTLSMRRATKCEGAAIVHRHISIHALHEESDAPATPPILPVTAISIHALHEESDLCTIWHMDIRVHFNPRSP